MTHTSPHYSLLTHALAERLRLSDGQKHQLDKQMRLLWHHIDVKDERMTKRQLNIIAQLLIEFLSAE